MAAPAIDVLVPVFNAATTLRAALDSILRQDRADLRLLVIDDGSTDASPDILAELARGDERVVVRRQPNGGIVDALNHGLSLCQAALVARHDADDIADPHRLSTQIRYLDAHPDCVAIGAAVRHVDADGKPLGHIARRAPPAEADPEWAPAREPYIIHPFLTARLDALRRVGCYRPVAGAEDSDLYWRLQEIGRLHNPPDVLGDYRIHGGSVSTGSLVSARQSAVCSQLAALSALRRRRGAPDLAFSADANAALRQAGTLEAMVRLAAAPLEPAEADRLAIASAAKLLDFASYRAIEPDRADASFIARAIAAHERILQAPNRASLRRVVANAAARLATTGHVATARALVGPSSYGPVLLRIGHRLLTTPAMRRTLRLSPSRPGLGK